MRAPGQLPPGSLGAAQPGGLAVPLTVVPAGSLRAAWEAFYRDHEAEVFRVVLAVVGNREQAEDAVNEAFFRAFKQWERIGSDPARRRRWVIRTAINDVKRTWRRVGRRETPDQPARSHEPTTQTEIQQLVRQLLQQLSPRQREVIALRYLADLDPKEVAQLLGVSPNTVAVHEHRGMKLLRATLKDGGEAQ